jgi:hypothetical protein
MPYLNDYRNNTDHRADRDTRVAQGDFPVEVRTRPTREDTLYGEEHLEGSITEGVSVAHSIYVDGHQPMEGDSYVI